MLSASTDVSPLEDPIFEPWSSGESLADSGESLADHEAPEPESVIEAAAAAEPSPEREDDLPHPLGLLRHAGVPRLEAISRKLRLARHGTALSDLLDGPTRLLRFELTPWINPLSARSPRSAVLEIGLASESDPLVTAWYWLDASGGAPYKTSVVSSEKLDPAWVERTALDFVARVLERR
jgi:hypothetical protein